MGTGIKFKASVEDLNKALGVVSIVPPKPLTPQGESGYLFVVRGPVCYVYSRDTTRVARAHFSIEDVEGEGAFIYPSNIAGFQHLSGPISFETDTDTEGNPLVRYRCDGSVTDKMVFDPRLLAPFDKEYDAAKDKRTFPSAILRLAIGQAKGYLLGAKETKAEDHFKTLQLFDASKEEYAKGDGTLYASDGTQAFYFWCDTFKGKGLAIHTNFIGSLQSLLGRTDGEVTFTTGANMTFATDSDGYILGWAHHTKAHAKFGYYGVHQDKIVLRVDKTLILKSLRHLRSELDAKHDKVKMTFSNSENRFTFQVNDGKSKVEGIPVPITEITSTTGEDLWCFVNIDHLISIFDDVHTQQPELRMCPVPPSPARPKGTVGMRTIDDFWLNAEGKQEIVNAESPPEDGFQCRVTRFVPSKD